MRTNSRGAFTITCMLVAIATFVLPVSLFAVTTIDQYIVYGEHGVQIGGGSTVNGLVGARFPDVADHGIFLNGGAITIGDARCATNVNLANNAHITGTVYVPSLSLISMGSGSSIGATNIGNPDLPVFPSATVFSAGTSNVTTTTTPLAPGSYGSVTYANGGDLKMSAGTYFFASLSLSGTTQVHLDTTGGNINIFVTGDVGVDGRDAIVTGANQVNWEIHGDWTQGGGSTGWKGTLFVPFGTAHVGSGSGTTDYTGQIWANLVDIQHNVTVTMIPEPTTLALAALGLLFAAGVTRKTVRR
jgi:hypothetical protein